MVGLYRAGGLPTADDLRNPSAVWFDSVSTDWLNMANQFHVPRTDSVFMALTFDDAWEWAGYRIGLGLDATIYEIEIPDDVVLKAYRYKNYDNAIRVSGSSPPIAETNPGIEWFVNAYWLSGVTVDHWFNMWSRGFEEYDSSLEWEVKVPLAVASEAHWEVFMDNDTFLANSRVNFGESLENYVR